MCSWRWVSAAALLDKHGGRHSDVPALIVNKQPPSAIFNRRTEPVHKPISHDPETGFHFTQVNASTVELVDLENYVNEVVQGKPIVLWNLELDTLRADLGELEWPMFKAHLPDSAMWRCMWSC